MNIKVAKKNFDKVQLLNNNSLSLAESVAIQLGGNYVQRLFGSISSGITDSLITLYMQNCFYQLGIKTFDNKVILPEDNYSVHVTSPASMHYAKQLLKI